MRMSETGQKRIDAKLMSKENDFEGFTLQCSTILQCTKFIFSLIVFRGQGKTWGVVDRIILRKKWHIFLARPVMRHCCFFKIWSTKNLSRLIDPSFRMIQLQLWFTSLNGPSPHPFHLSPPIFYYRPHFDNVDSILDFCVIFENILVIIPEHTLNPLR